MNTNNIYLAITVIAVAGILTGPMATANAWLYDIYSDEPLRVSSNIVPFVETYVDNLGEYVEEHNMESIVADDFIV